MVGVKGLQSNNIVDTIIIEYSQSTKNIVNDIWSRIDPVFHRSLLKHLNITAMLFY